MKPMLLVPNHYLVGEPETLSMETAEVVLAKAIESRYGKVSIAAFEASQVNDSLQGKFPRGAFDFYRLNVLTGNVRWIQKLINYCWATLVLPFTLAKHNWAYLFVPSPSAVIAAIWAKLLGRPYGLYVRGTWMTNDGNTSLIWRLVLRHAHFIVATGEAFKKKISAFNQNVQNEVPLTMLRVATLGKEIDRRSTRTRSILYVGHLSETKGVLDLVKAIGIAKNEMKLDVVIDFVGGASSEEETSIRMLSHECGIEKQLTLWGHIKDGTLLMQRYTEADIFAFPSFYREGFPRVLYEAMMHGLPIITTKMPGIDGFLEDGRNCLHCQARNPLDIAKRIQQLVLNPMLGVRLGLAGHQQVADLFKNFHHHNHADQVISLAANIFDENTRVLSHPVRGSQ